MDNDSTRRALRVNVAVTVLFAAAYWIFLALKPVSPDLVGVVDDIADAAGALLGFLFCLGLPRWLRHGSAGVASTPLLSGWRRRSPLLLGLSSLCYAVGSAVWAYYDLIIHQPPFPSWADAAYLSSYPLLLTGILLLPIRPLDMVSRTRVALDGLMLMAAIVTFSWYVVLGPTVLQGGEDLLGKVVGTAYPLFDLVLIFCLLVLWSRRGNRAMRPIVILISCGLILTVVADSVFDVASLQGASDSVVAIDPMWSLGYLLIGLAAQMTRYHFTARDAPHPNETALPGQAPADAPSHLAWLTWLPYALIPAVGLWVLYITLTHGEAALLPGVYIGAALLIVLILLRQVLAFLENRRLYARLSEAYARLDQTHQQLESRNAEIEGHARRLEALNDELSAMNRRLEVMAATDALTGLPNRTLLRDRLAQSILLASREESPLALLLIDLDRFKEVNDTLGHDYGDALLQQVSRRMQMALRASDTVARLGGDEFAALVPGADEESAIGVARKLALVLSEPVTVKEHALSVGASIGIALYPEHGADAGTLLRQADVAMYTAKRSGSGHAVYAPEQNHHTLPRLALTGALRHAIAHDELCLHYQPITDVGTGQIGMVEALARWQHPELGLLSPDQFIPLAEQTGLIVPLTQWVLDEALRQCRLWRRSGLHLGVSVNLSTRLLHAPDLCDTVAELLQAHDVSPSALRLEVTETMVMADVTRALEVLTRLTELGVRIAIDDFGTGYSSLTYLRRLPVDEVKIDRSFVMNMMANQDDAAIVASTIGLGHSLGLSFVAEGVETGETWNLLAALGCDAIQGFYSSRPLPADELERWLRAAA